jgi:TonB family protein
MRRANRIILVVALSAGLLPHVIQAQKKEHVERKVVEKVNPVYPELAKRMHISGVVKLEAVVRSNGSVKSTKVLGGNPVLLDAASEAAQQWKFEAADSETNEVLQIVFEPQ